MDLCTVTDGCVNFYVSLGRWVIRNEETE
jgi:hypothetical protein